MGRDKALLELDGEPMAARVAGALVSAGAAAVIAVGGDVEGLRARGLDVEPDRWPGDGPLGGMLQALDRAGPPLVAVLACDLVRPDPTVIATLVGRASRAGADVAVPLVGDQPQWLHAVWRRRCAATVGAAFRAGERSVHGAAGALRVDLVEGLDGACLADADEPSALPADGDAP